MCVHEEVAVYPLNQRSRPGDFVIYAWRLPYCPIHYARKNVCYLSRCKRVNEKYVYTICGLFVYYMQRRFYFNVALVYSVCERAKSICHRPVIAVGRRTKKKVRFENACALKNTEIAEIIYQTCVHKHTDTHACMMAYQENAPHLSIKHRAFSFSRTVYIYAPASFITIALLLRLLPLSSASGEKNFQLILTSIATSSSSQQSSFNYIAHI